MFAATKFRTVSDATDKWNLCILLKNRNQKVFCYHHIGFDNLFLSSRPFTRMERGLRPLSESTYIEQRSIRRTTLSRSEFVMPMSSDTSFVGRYSCRLKVIYCFLLSAKHPFTERLICCLQYLNKHMLHK